MSDQIPERKTKQNSKREEMSSTGSMGCVQTKDNLNTVLICERKDDDSEAQSKLKPTSEEVNRK